MKSYTSLEPGFTMVITGEATLRARAEACMSLSFMKISNSLKIAVAWVWKRAG